MLNNKLGFFSAIIAGIATAIFAFAMIIHNNLLSYIVCMILSWAYITLACSFQTTFEQNRKAFGYSGVLFAVIYAVFINLVYFTQLTTVRQNEASPEVLKILTFEPGSWLFGFDLFGYGMMALSTFFLGISINP